MAMDSSNEDVHNIECNHACLSQLPTQKSIKLWTQIHKNLLDRNAQESAIYAIKL